MGIILIIFLLLVIFGGWPSWGYHSWGYAPVSVGTILLIVVIVLLLSGRL